MSQSYLFEWLSLYYCSSRVVAVVVTMMMMLWSRFDSLVAVVNGTYVTFALPRPPSPCGCCSTE